MRWLLLPSRERGELFGWRGDAQVDPRWILQVELTVFAHVLGIESMGEGRGKSREYIVFEWRTWVDGGGTPEMGKTGEVQLGGGGTRGVKSSQSEGLGYAGSEMPNAPTRKTYRELHGS